MAYVTLYTCPPELHRQGVLGEDLGRVSQRPARLVLALRRDNLGISSNWGVDPKCGHNVSGSVRRR